MCSTAKNKVSCLIICHVWFSLNNDHRAIWHSAQTRLWLHALTWRSNQDFGVRGRKRHTTSPFFTELIISLFPYYFFDLKGFFCIWVFCPLAFSWGNANMDRRESWLVSANSVSTPNAKLHSKYFTPSDLKHWIFGGLLKISLTESVAPTGNLSLGHQVFRDASINLC